MDITPSSAPVALPELSKETVETLKTLRGGPAQDFFAYVKSLRDNKWPLRAIASPLGVSRTAVSNWERSVLDSTPVPASERLPEVPHKVSKMAANKYQLSEKQSKDLSALAHEASKVRRFTDPNAKSRQDAKKLEDLLLKYTEEGASLGQLAKACKVSRSSIAQRLRKYSNE